MTHTKEELNAKINEINHQIRNLERDREMAIDSLKPLLDNYYPPGTILVCYATMPRPIKRVKISGVSVGEGKTIGLYIEHWYAHPIKKNGSLGVMRRIYSWDFKNWAIPPEEN